MGFSPFLFLFGRKLPFHSVSAAYIIVLARKGPLPLLSHIFLFKKFGLHWTGQGQRIKCVVGFVVCLRYSLHFAVSPTPLNRPVGLVFGFGLVLLFGFGLVWEFCSAFQ